MAQESLPLIEICAYLRWFESCTCIEDKGFKNKTSRTKHLQTQNHEAYTKTSVNFHGAFR